MDDFYTIVKLFKRSWTTQIPYASTLALVSWGLVSYEWLLFMNNTRWSPDCKASTLYSRYLARRDEVASIESRKIYRRASLSVGLPNVKDSCQHKLSELPSQKLHHSQPYRGVNHMTVLSNALQRVIKSGRNHQLGPDTPTPKNHDTACLAPMATMHSGRPLSTMDFWDMLFAFEWLKQSWRY
jgi:hypothetical protein